VGEPSPMLGRNRLLDGRITNRGEAEDEQRQEERDRGAEAAELLEEIGEEIVVVTGDEILHDAEGDATYERERDRAESAQRDRGERTEHDQRELGVAQLEE